MDLAYMDGFYANRRQGKPFSFAEKCELSFQAADGTVLKSFTSDEKYLKLGSSFPIGTSYFVNRNEVLVKRRHRYLIQDTLIARCRVWVGTGDIVETVQSTARTHICVERVAFMETFERFSEMQAGQIKSISIKSTSDVEPVMLIVIFLKADTLSEGRYVINVVPSRSKKEMKFSTCTTSLLDKIGNAIQCGQSEFSSTAPHWEFPLSFSKKDFMDNKMDYLPLDKLSLQFHFAFSVGDLCSEIEGTIYGSGSKTETSIRSINADTISECPSALEDLKSLYNDQILCDVRIKTETQTFSAHKTVLCARSPVFRAMFADEMKENIKDYIEVEDLEDDTLRRFLLFLYTDKLEDVPWKTVSKLYYAADKYQVKALKNKCSSVLIDNLDASNASVVLLLADMHQDNNLRENAEEFILENNDDVFSSDEWHSFSKSNPQLAVDTMLLMYRKEYSGFT